MFCARLGNRVRDGVQLPLYRGGRKRFCPPLARFHSQLGRKINSSTRQIRTQHLQQSCEDQSSETTLSGSELEVFREETGARNPARGREGTEPRSAVK